MAMTFKDRDLYSAVVLNGRVVGHILKSSAGGWFYQPRASKSFRGDKMPTREKVKESLK